MLPARSLYSNTGVLILSVDASRVHLQKHRERETKHFEGAADEAR